MISQAMPILAWVPAAIAAASAGYLAFLTVGAAVARPALKPPPPSREPGSRLAVLVPAHDEEDTISVLFESLAADSYPRHMLDVYVIADNCSDRTAEVAEVSGASVLVRNDPERRGKGRAVAWALEQLPLDQYDAVVMVDADTRVDPGFLRAVDARLQAGAEAVQGYYGVLEPRSTASSLRSISFALMHFVRPMGKTLFGGSIGLKGTGMAFSTDVLKSAGWRSFTVTEDAEQTMRILLDGVRVQFAPEARVWSEMPDRLSRSGSQNLRWEAGRWQTARRWALPLLRAAAARRSIAPADAAVEALIPPLSVIAALGVVAAASGVALGSPALMAAGVFAVSATAVHVLGGMFVAGVPRASWWSLVAAPVYLAWKLGVYARALLGAGSGEWVRTPRAPRE